MEADYFSYTIPFEKLEDFDHFSSLHSEDEKKIVAVDTKKLEINGKEFFVINFLSHKKIPLPEYVFDRLFRLKKQRTKDIEILIYAARQKVVKTMKNLKITKEELETLIKDTKIALDAVNTLESQCGNDIHVMIDTSEKIKAIIYSLSKNKIMQISSLTHTSNEKIKITNDKTFEQTNALLKSGINTQIVNLQETLKAIESLKKAAEDYGTEVDKTLMEIVLHKTLSISSLMNLLLVGKTKKVFQLYDDLYNMIANRQILGFAAENHVQDMYKGHSVEQNKIVILEKEGIIKVVYDQKFILFYFKHLVIDGENVLTPGISIIQRYLDNAKTLSENKIAPKSIILDDVEILLDNSPSGQFVLLQECSKLLNMGCDDYVRFLKKYNKYFLFESGKYVLYQNFDQLSEFVSKEELEMSKYLKMNYDVDLTVEMAAFSSKTVFEQLVSLIRKNNKFLPLLKLYYSLLDGRNSVMSFPELKEEGESYRLDVLEVKDQMIPFDDNAYYYFTKTGDNELNNKYGTKTERDIYNSIYSKKEYFRTSIEAGKLSKADIRELSQMFKFINRKSYQVSNIRVRDMLTIVNDLTKGEVRQFFIDLIFARLGDYSNLICSIWLFFNNTFFSKEGCALLKDLDWVNVKSNHWISFFSQLSLKIKQTRLIKDKWMTFTDFKNMQYIEMFIGQVGSDGKSAKDTASERLYKQFEKKFLDYSNVLTDQQCKNLATQIVEHVCSEFWNRVFRKYKRKGFKFPGICELIDQRMRYSTDSSPSGLQSKFLDIAYLKNNPYFEVIPDIDSKFEPGESNKASAFMSYDSIYFQRMLFDLPITIANMVPKPKEFAKFRYIYGVYIVHYIFNSLASYVFEPFMNQLGMKAIVNEFDNLFSKPNNKRLQNCLDFSVFNDQHEEAHKKLIWSTYVKVAKEHFPVEEYREMKLLGNWLEYSCENMWLRFNTDNSILIKHKGRLFSGERSTTLVNSIMSVCYMYLITVNTENFIHFSKFKQMLYSVEKDNIYNGDIYDLIKNNITLGDDNQYGMSSVLYAKAFNNIALNSGFILKFEKCMIGYDMAEFLRNIEVTTEKKNVTKGYMNRSIISIVAGNLEGNVDRNFLSRINEFFTQLSTVIQRGGNKVFCDLLFTNFYNVQTRINDYYKSKGGKSLPIELAYLPKKYGGLGLFKLDTYQYTTINKSIKIPKLAKNKLVTEIKKIHAQLIDAKLTRMLAKVKKYGEVHGPSVNRLVLSEINDMVVSNTTVKHLYDTQYLDEMVEFSKNVNSANFEYLNLIIERNHNIEKCISIVNNIMGEKSSQLNDVAQKLKYIDSLQMSFNLLKSDWKFTEVLFDIGGTLLVSLHYVKKNFEMLNVVNDYITQGAFNSLLSNLLSKIDNKSISLKECLTAIRYYFKTYYVLV